PLAFARDLIRCPSVTPAEGGALDYLHGVLTSAGFTVHRVKFSETGSADVVPPGEETAWTHAPFAGDIADGRLYGRGAVDMKGAIACFLAAALDHLAANGGKSKGSISFLITGDVEGDAVKGTTQLLQWAAEGGGV